MTDKLLEKYAGRGALGGKADSPSDCPEEAVAFGVLRGLDERSLMLEFRKKNGDCLAVGYTFIDRIAFDPSEGITVHCGSRTVTIKGKNLNAEVRAHVRLFESLTRHRISWIAEADQAARLQAGKNAVVVEAIEW